MHNAIAGASPGASGVGESDDPVVVDGGTGPTRAVDGGTGTLWVVDDTEAILVLARSVFERAGWRVATYEDLGGALAALEDGPAPDAVLLDIHLPDGNGLHHVRDFVDAGAAVVVVGNAAGPDQVEVAFAVGAGDVVPKPFDLRSLLARVERAARVARPERLVVPPPERMATTARISGPDLG